MQPENRPAHIPPSGSDSSAASNPNIAPGIQPLLLLLLLLVLMIVGGGYLVFQQLQQNEAQTVQQNLAAIADLKANEINRWIAENKTGIIISTDASPLADRTRQWMDGGMRQGADFDWLQGRLERIRQIHAYGEIAILDVTGRPLISTERMLPDVSDLQPLFAKALTSGEPAVGDMRWNRMRRGNPYIAVPFAAPLIASGPARRTVGILLIHADANQYLFPLVNAWPTPSKTGETFLIRQDGDNLLSLSELRHMPGSALKLRAPISNTDRLGVKVFRGEKGILHGLDYRGEPVIGYGKWIAGTDWLMVAKIDEGEIYAPLRRMAMIITATGFVLLLVSSLVLYLWWRQRNDQYRSEQIQAEFERQFVTRQYETLSKYANDIILLFDLEYKIIDANDRAEQALGLSRSELIGSSLLNITRPGDRARIETYWAQILQRESIIFDDTALVRTDGTAFHIEASARLIEVGNAKYIHCVIRDITERKRFEEELQRREQEYRQLVEGLPKTNIARYDDGCRFIFASPGIGENFGLTTDVIIGRRPTEVDMDPEFASVLEKAIGDVLRSGKQTAFQFAYKTSKGRSHREFTLIPESTEDGRVKTVLQTSYEITELKALESSLQQALGIIEGITQGSTDTIAALDNEFRVLFVNEAYRREFKNLWSRDVEIGDSMIELLAPWPEDQSKSHELWRRALQGERFSLTTEFGAEERRQTIELRFNPIYGAQGQQIGAAHIATNVTERERLQHAMRRSEARWNAAIETLDVGAIIATEYERVIYWNQTARRMHGLVRAEEGIEQLGNMPATFQLWTLDGSRMLTLDEWPMRRIRLGERVRNLELRLRRTDQGWERIMSYSGSMVETASGERLIFLSVHDMTEQRNAERALKESEERYRSLFANMNEGLALCEVIFDNEGVPVNYRFLDINEGFTQQTGLLRERMVGKVATEALPKLEPIWLERFLQVGVTGKPLRFTEYNVDTKRYYDINCYSPSYGRFAFLARDVTQQRQSEEALKESEARFRQLANAMPQLVWTARPDGVVDYYNERYHEYSGFRQKETGEFDWAPVIHPDDLDVTLRAWNHAIQTGEMYQIEHRVERADGRYHWHISRALPFKDDHGKIARWFGTATDIHELKLAQEAAQRNEERLRLAQIVARMGSFEWNLQTGVNEWSPELETLYGLRSGEFERTYDAWKRRVLPEDRDQADRLTRAGVDSGSFEAEWRVQLPNGSIRWIVGRGQVFKDDSGRPVRMVGINVDITARKQAEEERARALHQLEAVLENLAEGVIIFDGKGNVSSMNSTALRMHGFTDMQQALRHLADFEHEFALFDSVGQPMHLPDWPMARVLKGERFADLEVHVRQKRTGNGRIFAYSGSPITDDRNTVYLGVLTLRDITESKRAEEELKLAALVYQESAEAMMVTDEANRIIAINPAFERLTGYKSSEVAGKSPRMLSAGQDSRANYREMLQKLTHGNYWQGELWLSKKSGERFAAGMTINTTFHDDGSVSRHVALFNDITERKHAEEIVWQQANYDPLTNLPNRRHFLDQLKQEIKKSRRSGLPFALMFMDLDGFKSVNDTLGHEAGDLLLKETADRLAKCVRETDMVARLGGDEFIIILSELRSTHHAEKVAQHILHKVADPFEIGGEVAHVSGSVGITLYPQDASSIDDLLINADNAMYSAKEAGKNRYSFFTEAMQKAAQERMWLASELRSAIDGRQFRLVYQPIVELSSGCINKAEALLRWEHPVRGLIDPALFIPIAEETGMIQEIGDWVFFEAANQVARWRKDFHPEFQVSVNKSPVQFKSKVDDLAIWFDYLKTLNLPGQAIAVEITEGVLMDESKAVVDQLLAFRDAGIEVALDDFGTGYSTLSYLKRFDIDRLKIDQTFVRDLENDANDQALCEAMIVMGHKLGIKVIAEGVETDKQRQILASAGCDFVQGYLVSTPVSAESLNDLLRSGASHCAIVPLPPGSGMAGSA